MEINTIIIHVIIYIYIKSNIAHYSKFMQADDMKLFDILEYP